MAEYTNSGVGIWTNGTYLGAAKDVPAACSIVAELNKLAADIEIMQNALDHLTCSTIGPAMLGNICEAGRYEIQCRIDYAEEQRKRCQCWKDAEKETDEQEARNG